MRLRPILAAAAASALVLAGLGSTAARAEIVHGSSLAGTLVTWGDTADPTAAAAIQIPDDVTTPVADIAADARATAAVTVDGKLLVWGQPDAVEVHDAPTGVTDATAVAISPYGGAVIHEDGSVTGWGSAALADVPDGLKAQAIAVGGTGTGYAVTLNPDNAAGPGSLVEWGADPVAGSIPSNVDGVGDLFDVSANAHQVLVRTFEGEAVAWGDSPVYDSVPAGIRAVTQIATGPSADGVVLDDGSIRVWGESVPAGQPDLAGTKVVDLALGTGAGAVTDDGAVHIWGMPAAVGAVPDALTGEQVSAIVVGDRSAAAIVAFGSRDAPTIAGNPQVGQTLTATPGTFSLAQAGVPTAPTGQWYDGVLPIAGETGTTMRVDDSLLGAVISYRSTEVRGGLSQATISNELGPITDAGSAIALRVSPAAAAAGTTRTAVATVERSGGVATGAVTFRVGARSRRVLLEGGRATWKLPVLPVGRWSVTATYAGSGSAEGSTSVPVTIVVAKAGSTIRTKARASGAQATLRIRVKTARVLSAAGRVTVSLKGHRAVQARVDAAGRAVVVVKGLRRGTHVLRVAYSGNALVAANRTTTKVTT